MIVLAFPVIAAASSDPTEGAGLLDFHPMPWLLIGVLAVSVVVRLVSWRQRRQLDRARDSLEAQRRSLDERRLRVVSAIDTTGELVDSVWQAPRPHNAPYAREIHDPAPRRAHAR